MRADLHLPEGVIEAVAQRAAELVAERMNLVAAPAPSRWLTVEQAAAHIAAPKQRIYDLRSAGRLSDHREGGRALVDRDELDALIVAERSGSTP
jgi:excisionase family DNA binding protein